MTKDQILRKMYELHRGRSDDMMYFIEGDDYEDHFEGLDSDDLWGAIPEELEKGVGTEEEDVIYLFGCFSSIYEIYILKPILIELGIDFTQYLYDDIPYITYEFRGQIYDTRDLSWWSETNNNLTLDDLVDTLLKFAFDIIIDEIYEDNTVDYSVWTLQDVCIFQATHNFEYEDEDTKNYIQDIRNENYMLFYELKKQKGE